MVASELRIGNYVTVMGSLPHEVTGYHLYMMENYVPKDPNEADYKEMTQPIPLNEEWLTKCANDEYGFYKQADGSYSLIDDCGDGTTCYLGNLRYVHQLQNLYFALIGEELTIKE